MDRLITAVDDYLSTHPEASGTGQIGNTELKPAHLNAHSHFTPGQFRRELQQADVFVSHAGMGNLMLARELAKPIVIMAREHRYGEHINDHQFDTLQAFADRDFVFCVAPGQKVDVAIDAAASWRPREQTTDAPDDLALKLRDYINEL